MTPNEQRLRAALLPLSASPEWGAARLEWQLEYVEFAHRDDPTTCSCGHYPIIEMCWLRNEKTRRPALVGNVCVQKFLDTKLNTGKVFDALSALRLGDEPYMNDDMIIYAWTRWWITDWEAKFLQDTRRSRYLSEKQLRTRHAIYATLQMCARAPAGITVEPRPVPDSWWVDR